MEATDHKEIGLIVWTSQASPWLYSPIEVSFRAERGICSAGFHGPTTAAGADPSPTRSASGFGMTRRLKVRVRHASAV